jgi:hypothetical protein
MFNVLLQEKVPSDMLVFKFLPHGLLNFDVPQGLPQAKYFVIKTIRYLEIMFLRQEENIKKVGKNIKNAKYSSYKKIFKDS